MKGKWGEVSEFNEKCGQIINIEVKGRGDINSIDKKEKDDSGGEF